VQFSRLAALGAVGVSLGAIALYLLVGFISRPTGTGGMDSTQSVVVWISLAIPIIAIVVVHLVYAKVLLDESKRAPR
jgi:hypothetical protein